VTPRSPGSTVVKVLVPGQTFGRYVIEELIGAGGMGQVYRALDTVLHRHVALKILLVEQSDPAQWDAARARMLREARAAAALQHPNAVAIYDLGTIDDTPYIAMELVRGESLRAFVPDRTVPWDRKLRWMLDVASALAAAHAAGLVHRDIKPDNVLVRPDGPVKVLDFGIARSAVRRAQDAAPGDVPATQITGDGTVLGTPRYMAPEQIAGRPLDGRADQFAWAVTAYELLTGTAPWPENPDAPLALAAAILTEPTPPLHAVAPELPLAVAQAIERALSKRPEERFPSMDDVVTALDGYAAPVVPASTASGPALSGNVSGVRGVDPYAHTRASPETGKALAADPPTSVMHRPTRRRGWLAGALAVGLLGVAATGLAVRSRASRPLQPSAPPAESAASALAVTALPRPVSSNAAALTLYATGLQAQHDANRSFASAQLGKAAEADPSMAAAHLRFALSSFFPSPVAPRKHFLLASQQRASLSRFDQALLDGVEPVFDRQPPDFAEADRKLEALTTKIPNDAELYGWLAWVRLEEGKLPELREAAAHALQLDPSYAAVREVEAQAAQIAGDTDAVLREVAACLEAAPQAVACVHRRMETLASEGRCIEYESDARRILAIDPGSADGDTPLAEASFVLGRPIDSVREALAQSWSKLRADDAVWQKDNDDFTLTSLLGDATGQGGALLAMQKAASGRPEIYYHMVPAWGGVHVATEAGDLAKAAAVADDYLRHRDAWTADPGIDMWSVALDQTPFMLKALVRGGKLSYADFQAKRHSWIEGWRQRVGPAVARYLWIYGYATVTDTPEEATEALAALPAFEPLPPFRPSLLAEADVGRTLLLGGRVDEATRLLRRAAGNCNAFENPFEWVRSSLWLGEALEARGDTAGACAAYGQVTRRWGKLGKRSTSAALAGKRMASLRCGKE
jgi:serine/threonine protein kinase/tetratricopeptide (TPR) repeat protein